MKYNYLTGGKIELLEEVRTKLKRLLKLKLWKDNKKSVR